MERDRAKLLQQTFAELNSAFTGQNRRAHTAQPPLAVNRVKVTFRDEPGEGSGVARSFYTSVAEVLTTYSISIHLSYFTLTFFYFNLFS
jgi:E3 ubiquitin-protein ligase EDD1